MNAQEEYAEKHLLESAVQAVSDVYATDRAIAFATAGSSIVIARRLGRIERLLTELTSGSTS